MQCWVRCQMRANCVSTCACLRIWSRSECLRRRKDFRYWPISWRCWWRTIAKNTTISPLCSASVDIAVTTMLASYLADLGWHVYCVVCVNGLVKKCVCGLAVKATESDQLWFGSVRDSAGHIWSCALHMSISTPWNGIKGKGKVNHAPQGSVGGCSSPSSRSWAHRWRTTNVCDVWPMRRQTYPAARHHHPLAGTKLYCLVTEAHEC